MPFAAELECGRATQLADGLGVLSLPPESDPQVVVRFGVLVVGGERRAKPPDRGFEITGLELQVAEVRQRRRAAAVLGEGSFELGLGSGALAARQQDQTTLVAGGGPRPRVRGRGQGPAECLPGFVEAPGAQRPGAERGVVGRSCREPEPAREEPHRSMLHVDVITLFPEMFAPVIGLSIVGRAIERGLIAVEVHDLLDALEPGERADERPYGGGPGMVLRIEPLARTLDALLAAAPPGERRRIVLTAASGRPFAHADAAAWAQLDRLVVVCGHYEGVDERLGTLFPLEEVSLGSFVLTGGEIAAMAFIDATVRLVEGAIAPESRTAESFVAGADALDYPAFTRPAIFRGVAVPEVLLSGDHARIAEWRRQRARARAAARATRANLNG